MRMFLKGHCAFRFSCPNLGADSLRGDSRLRGNDKKAKGMRSVRKMNDKRSWSNRLSYADNDVSSPVIARSAATRQSLARDSRKHGQKNRHSKQHSSSCHSQLDWESLQRYPSYQPECLRGDRSTACNNLPYGNNKQAKGGGS